MQKFRIPYIPYRSLLLSTTVLNDNVIHAHLVFLKFLKLICMNVCLGVPNFEATRQMLHHQGMSLRMHADDVCIYTCSNCKICIMLQVM